LRKFSFQLTLDEITALVRDWRKRGEALAEARSNINYAYAALKTGPLPESNRKNMALEFLQKADIAAGAAITPPQLAKP
jgi:hypothetical protein